MTNEEKQAAIEWLKGRPITMPGAKKMYDLAIEALDMYVPEMNVGDMISRQAAMERLMAQNVIMDGSEYHNGFNAGANRAQEVIRNLPPVRFTTLSDDEIETIRIHLSAIKEKLCNQGRYSEAAYYEKLIAKLLSSNPKEGEADGQE